MVLDPNTNTVFWTPNSTQVGLQTAAVEVNDGQGGSAQQTFQIDVLAADLPPLISSEPPTLAGTGVAYAYQVVAVDPDGSIVSYSVTSTPTSSIMINNATGLLQWSSPSGNESITVTASDGVLAATQTYTLTVQSAAPGSPPIITSTPPLFASVGTAYPYTVTATDPQNNPLKYAVSESPVVTGSDLTIDPNSGVVSWTPNSGELRQRRRGHHGHRHRQHAGFAGRAELQRADRQLAAADDHGDAAGHDHRRASPSSTRCRPATRPTTRSPTPCWQGALRAC